MDFKPYDDINYRWNSIRPRESEFKPVVAKIFKDLRAWLPFFDTLQQTKENYSLDGLNKLYIDYMLSYVQYRDKILKLILATPDLFTEVQQFAKDNILFDILIDAYSIDVNRNNPKNSKVLPMLPYRNQLPLLHALEYGTKSVLVEKSRRGGASFWMAYFQRRMLIHGHNISMIVANKDKDSADKGKNDLKADSSLTRVDYMLDRSIFVPKGWREDYNTAELRAKEQAIYRSYKPAKIVYKSNKLEVVVYGLGTGTGSAANYLFGDEFDVWAEMHPNQEKALFDAFASAVNRMVIYSTYRSVEFSMYRTRENNNTDIWDFIRLYWKDNPTCNQAWFKYQAGKLNFSEVAIARELEINPAKAISGRILPNFNQEIHALTPQQVSEKYGDIWDASIWERYVFSDNGGNKNSQNYIKVFFNRAEGILYHYDFRFIDDLQPADIRNWCLNDTFGVGTILADEAVKANHTFSFHSTAYLMRQQGFNVIEVSNRDIITVHVKMRQHISEGRWLVNAENTELVKFTQSYRYKEDGTINKSKSHVGDAMSYGFRALFLSSSVELLRY